MGYTTRFTGRFAITPPLTLEHLNEYKALADLDRRKMPTGAPDAYLQWQPTPDGAALCWDGNEKFYCYQEWLFWLAVNWFAPRGYALSGEVKFQGEEIGDVGTLSIIEGRVSLVRARFDSSPLDACREIVRRYEAGIEEPSEFADLARAAIAKAEGRQ